VARREAQDIIAFLHIIKAGGTTIESLLRRNYGFRHIDAFPREGILYNAADLTSDLRLFPFARSISGHRIRPYIHYGEHDERLVWFTWLRKPMDRFVSAYQHRLEKWGATLSFQEWMDGPGHRNRHVCMLAGEEDLEAAKQILAKKIRCVGLLERFNESLLLMRHLLGLDGFDVVYGRPRNQARSRAVRERIRGEIERSREAVLENNHLDQQLYDYAVAELYPRQVDHYGAERLRQDLRRVFAAEKGTLGGSVRELECAAFRKFAYRPLRKVCWLLTRKPRDEAATAPAEEE